MSDVSQDLWLATDRLTNSYRQRLERDHGQQEWVRMASLLDQLTEAVQSGAGSREGSGVEGSRAPLDVACLSLLFDITETIRDAMRSFDVKRTFDTGRDLRALVSRLTREPDSDEEQEWWVGRVNGWCGQIKATISSDPDRPWQLHNVPCPECRAKTVTVAEDGEEVRKAAVLVTWSRELVRAVECRACGAVWYRGTDLETLVERMLARHDTPSSTAVA